MIVIVDGYNVIRIFEKTLAVGGTSEYQRDRFVQRLCGYVLKKKGTIKRLIVAFDGGSFAYPESVSRGGVLEVYSGYKKTADDWIFDHVSVSSGCEFVVVTDDRALGKRLKPYVSLIVAAEAFKEFVCRSSAFNDASHVVRIKKELVAYDNYDVGFGDVDKNYLWELMEGSTRSIMAKRADSELKNDARLGSSGTDSKQELKIKRIIKKM